MFTKLSIASFAFALILFGAGSHGKAADAIHENDTLAANKNALQIAYSQWVAGLPWSSLLIASALASAIAAVAVLRKPGSSAISSKESSKGSEALKAGSWGSNVSSFPPSTRSRVVQILSAARQGDGPKEPPSDAPNDAQDATAAQSLPAEQAPFGVASDQVPGEKRTATNVRLDEIRALGDFPDYASLSGVPWPAEYAGFDLRRALPRPYRPFRWNYVQNMSLMRFEPDWWLEVTRYYTQEIAQRLALYEKHKDMVMGCLPGAEIAAKEIMEIALQFYCKRYPMHFKLEQRTDVGYVFVNGILGTETILKDKHPLHVLLHNIPEEFAIMMRNEDDGRYYLRGGLIFSAIGWTFQEKLGKPLSEIHKFVPDYKEKMQPSMDRYFAKMPSDRPIQRGSWSLEIGKPLLLFSDSPESEIKKTQPPDLTLDQINLRVDWQTLRRLPLSGAIVFNFKAVFYPVTDFRQEPGIPKLLHTISTKAKANLLEYKNGNFVEHVLLPALEAWTKEQEDKGLLSKDWEVGTMDESPFFKGWEQLWQARQDDQTR